MGQLQSVRLSDDRTAVIILDQSRLPNETVYLELRGADEFYDALLKLRVRGAPAIGIFAAYALYVLARQSPATNYEGFYNELLENSFYLDSARPTAVNLSRQLRRMEQVARDNSTLPVEWIVDAMREEAVKIHREDIEMCTAISEHGLTLIRDGFGILTHCNAGPLATSRYGTGLGTILLAKERGIKLRVFCDETRPLLQGARLTTFELLNAGVECTLICDNMASAVMSEGNIDAVFVGCDRVALNGDTANKIGTSGIAVLAKHYGIPFYVFCPSSSIDPSIEKGTEIKIEHRDPNEIKSLYFSEPIAPAAVKCYNPAFDVTPGELITAIITEKGVITPPFEQGLSRTAGLWR